MVRSRSAIRNYRKFHSASSSTSIRPSRRRHFTTHPPIAISIEPAKKTEATEGPPFSPFAPVQLTVSLAQILIAALPRLQDPEKIEDRELRVPFSGGMPGSEIDSRATSPLAPCPSTAVPCCPRRSSYASRRRRSDVRLARRAPLRTHAENRLPDDPRWEFASSAGT